jgi:hypothetical protein
VLVFLLSGFSLKDMSRIQKSERIPMEGVGDGGKYASMAIV